jgi:hypothetical protein
MWILGLLMSWNRLCPSLKQTMHPSTIKQLWCNSLIIVIKLSTNRDRHSPKWYLMTIITDIMRVCMQVEINSMINMQISNKINSRTLWINSCNLKKRKICHLKLYNKMNLSNKNKVGNILILKKSKSHQLPLTLRKLISELARGLLKMQVFLVRII